MILFVKSKYIEIEKIWNNISSNVQTLTACQNVHMYFRSYAPFRT